MQYRSLPARPALAPMLLAVLAGTLACSSPEQSVAASHGSHGAHDARGGAATVKRVGPPPGEVARQLAELRRATAPFHNIEHAKAAGYSVQVTGCMDNPAGAQGFHYGPSPDTWDNSVSLLEPELLMYEPRPGGTLQLVGMEYVIPVDQWTSSTPPSLLGQEFHVNPAFGIWVLHLWLWRDNPLGMFEDWNPKVSCEHASAVS